MPLHFSERNPFLKSALRARGAGYGRVVSLLVERAACNSCHRAAVRLKHSKAQTGHCSVATLRKYIREGSHREPIFKKGGLGVTKVFRAT